MFNGLQCDMSTIFLLSDAQSRSICAENPTGEKSGGGRAVPKIDENGNPTGPAKELGQGWKVRPKIIMEPGQTVTLADIAGPGCIQHIWITPQGNLRTTIIRIYYDDLKYPAVECPIGDFFASAYVDSNRPVLLNSLMVCVNPGSGFNCYWPMPFRKRIRITLENLDLNSAKKIFYQIDYALNDIPEDSAYFHASFRRMNPLKKGNVYTIIDEIKGSGHYVGTYLAWQVNNNGWWGEGEIKFYIDGDADPEISEGKVIGGSTGFPTICGTGTEDYFCGSYNFENREEKRYQEYCTPYCGVPHIVRPDGLYSANQRFSMYRWHIIDPIRFKQDLKVTIQALGWKDNGCYLPLQDDIASVAFWYQTLPSIPFPPIAEIDDLKIF